MIALSQSKTKRLVSLHGWSGVLIAMLLYVVVLSGAVVVFIEEIRIWSLGSTSTVAALERPIDRFVRQQARTVDPAYLHEVTVRGASSGKLRVFFHGHARRPDTGEVAEKGVLITLDPETGEVLTRREGFSPEIFSGSSRDALSSFLLRLHINLHIPGSLGLFATGFLGLWMMISGFTGLLAHRHTIGDVFVAERPGGRLVSARDRHVLAGTWGLVFTFLLAFTGAFFSFAISLGVPIVGMVAAGGDQQKLAERVLGVPRPVDATPATMASLDYILMDARNRTGTYPRSMLIENWGRADALVRTFHEQAEGGLVRTTHLFEGPSRAYIGPKPGLGTRPSIGDTAVSLMGPLHFGNFAGILSKAVWGAMGAALCFVILSGTRLWIRRRQDQPGWLKFRRAMIVVIWGTPLAMIAAAYGHFLAAPVGASGWWTPAAFLLACLYPIWLGVAWTDPTRISNRLRRTVALALIALPLCRLLTGGTSWADALLGGRTVIPSIDILLVLGGIVLAVWPRIETAFRKNEPRPQLSVEPAE